MFEAETRETDRQSKPTIRWRIAHKLTIASVLMILLTLLAGGVGLWQVLTIGQAVSDAREKAQQRAWSLELLAAGHRLVAALDYMLLTQDPTLMSTDVPVSLGTLIFYMETMQAYGGAPETADTLEEIRTTYDELRRAVSEVDVLARQERWTEVETALNQEIRPANKYMNLLLRRLARQTGYDVQAATLRAHTVVQRAALLLAILVAFTTAIALGWRQFVFRGMGHSITELRQGVARISSGDLEYKLAVRTGDEIEELGDEFNKMADELAGLIGGLEQQVAERTRDLERHAAQLESLNTIAATISQVLNLDEVLNLIARQAVELLEVETAAIPLINEDGIHMTYTAVYGRLAETLSGRVKLLSDDGFCTWVLRHKQEFYSDDLATDKRRIENEETRKRLGVRTVISTPMFFKGEIIGAITAVNRLDGSLFTRADLEERLRPLANQAAIAIQNARLFEQTEASLHELNTLYRLHTQTEWGRLTREQAEPTGYRYSPTGVSPTDEDWWPEIGEAARHGETRTLNDDGSHVLTTPITLRGQAIGDLSFRRPAEAEAWSTQDAALMEATADQVALALENVRLMHESRQWAQREFTIREIADKVSASFDLETILRTTVEELSAVLGASGALVELGLPQEET